MGSEAGRKAACRSVGQRPELKEGAGHNTRKNLLHVRGNKEKYLEELSSLSRAGQKLQAGC